MARTKREAMYVRRYLRVEIKRLKKELSLCERLAEDTKAFNTSQVGAIIRPHTIDLVFASSIMYKGMPIYIEHIKRHLLQATRRYNRSFK